MKNTYNQNNMYQKIREAITQIDNDPDYVEREYNDVCAVFEKRIPRTVDTFFIQVAINTYIESALDRAGQKKHGKYDQQYIARLTMPLALREFFPKHNMLVDIKEALDDVGQNPQAESCSLDQEYLDNIFEKYKSFIDTLPDETTWNDSVTKSINRATKKIKNACNDREASASLLFSFLYFRDKMTDNLNPPAPPAPL